MGKVVEKAAVVVVEDDSDTAALMEAWLDSDRRYECAGRFRDAVSARREILRLRPHVLAIDIGLPGPSGSELLWSLRKDGFDARALLITGLATEMVVLSALIGSSGAAPEQAPAWDGD